MNTILKATGLTAALAAIALMTGCRSVPKYVAETTRINQPPPGKALVNFHRPSSFAKVSIYGIFDGEGHLLIALPAKSEFQFVCDPGHHSFIGYAEMNPIVEADLAADGVYDIMADGSVSWVKVNFVLNPLTKDDPRRKELADFERREPHIVVMVPNEKTEDYERTRWPVMKQFLDQVHSGDRTKHVLYLQKDDARQPAER